MFRGSEHPWVWDKDDFGVLVQIFSKHSEAEQNLSPCWGHNQERLPLLQGCTLPGQGLIQDPKTLFKAQSVWWGMQDWAYWTTQDVAIRCTQGKGSTPRPELNLNFCCHSYSGQEEKGNAPLSNRAVLARSLVWTARSPLCCAPL